MIVALAGRRIDTPNAPVLRFPLENIERVRRRLHQLFLAQSASVLVCSAACGADLLGLEVAGSLGIRRRIVLPFTVTEFRKTSVVDRPGPWGPIYDSICAEVNEKGDLVLLGCSTHDPDAYAAASRAILDEAERLLARSADGSSILPVIVWDGNSRGDDDETAAFGRAAEARGFRPVEKVLTK
jgi:hypothetical protein